MEVRLKVGSESGDLEAELRYTVGWSSGHDVMRNGEISCCLCMGVLLLYLDIFDVYLRIDCAGQRTMGGIWSLDAMMIPCMG